jgi:predicted metal-dependent hydrolase
LIPQLGSNKFSAHESDKLYWHFTRLNAEAQVLLEQFFIVALRAFCESTKDLDLRRAARKLMREELVHSRAYKTFLFREKEFGWPSKHILLRRPLFTKKWMSALIRHQPLALILTAAKFETYSLFYSRYLSELYGRSANSWVELNRLHVVDEVHHVTFDYEFYADQVGAMPFWKRALVAVQSSLFFLGMQIVLFRACTALIQDTFPQIGIRERVRRALMFAKWGVRDFRPYQETRALLKENFKKRGFVHSKLLSFFYW